MNNLSTWTLAFCIFSISKFVPQILQSTFIMLYFYFENLLQTQILLVLLAKKMSQVDNDPTTKQSHGKNKQILPSISIFLICS